MERSYSESYAAAGVDIEAGYSAVKLMRKHVERTKTKGVLDSIGGFGGLFGLDLTGIKEPVLVSGTDGVGTKLKLAFLMDKHDTIGIDCVAMCVNDIICCGGKPLIFLDYIACGKNIPEKIAQIVKGVADGCVKAGCALIGGETAEMPGFYPEDEYDLAGYSSGIVDKSKIVDNSKINTGDIIIGLASSGVHSNGFSLVRKIFDITCKESLMRSVPNTEKTLGEILLVPTEIYVKPILSLLENIEARGISHITGGGFFENIPRSLPEGLAAKITKDSYDIPPIFRFLQSEGNIPERDMYNTFNMGLGMTLITTPDKADEAVGILRNNGAEAYCIGSVIEINKSGERVVLV